MADATSQGTFYVIVIDGLGVGAQEDAAEYGDANANTLGHVSEVTGCSLPNLKQLGLGNIIPLHSIEPVPKPLAAYGKMREKSTGKDSTTGHWEIAGIHMQTPFPTYPEGFPESVIESFCNLIGVEYVLCNKPYSGTEVIADYGAQHLETGQPIVYTSADSVFQVAAHVDVVSVDQLYKWCEIAREKVCIGEHGIGRVIARPFRGEPGKFERISDQRHDFSRVPPKPNLLSLLEDHDIKRYSIGKIIDLFAEQGFTQYRRTKSNAEGISQLLSLMSAQMDGFVFVNLIDTDQKYGHRLDPDGFASSLEEFDRALPEIIKKLRQEDVLVITGDHGNDPTVESTDHAREFTPLLVYPVQRAITENLGIRDGFYDVAQSVAEYFALEAPFPGKAFVQNK
ncbi:MAG: phosphopentomutase [Bacteroidota bacterium]